MMENIHPSLAVSECKISDHPSHLSQQTVMVRALWDRELYNIFNILTHFQKRKNTELRQFSYFDQRDSECAQQWILWILSTTQQQQQHQDQQQQTGEWRRWSKIR